MQWNVCEVRRPSGLFSPVPDPVWVYFVHSYAAEATGPEVVATCDYGGPVAAAVEQGPLWATQFHPEKSGTVGLAVLEGFVHAAGAARAGRAAAATASGGGASGGGARGGGASGGGASDGGARDGGASGGGVPSAEPGAST